MAVPHCIDVHEHIVPAAYRQALADSGSSARDRFPVPAWDPQRNLEHLEVLGIATAFLSLSSPDVRCETDRETSALYRAINEEGAGIVRDRPERFGYFAALPLPDVEAAIQEATYVYEELGVDGIRLTTNTEGLYLGDGLLEPLFERLNDYGAVIFIHPCKPSAVPDTVLTDYPVPMLEFMFDTARAVTNLVLGGVVARCPRVRFIVPHMGGVLPILIPRIHSLVDIFRKPEGRPDVLGGFRSLYYDSAGPSFPQTLLPLLNLTDDTHLLFGSDWPHMPTDQGAAAQDTIANIDQITEAQKRGLFHDNALSLFPRLIQAK